MFTFIFSMIFFCLGYAFRGSRLAKWLHSWFEQVPESK